MDEHVIRSYARTDIVFVSGSGAILRDETGREYLDFLSGIGVNSLGHGHPRLIAALREQIGRVLHTSNLFRHPFTERVAEQIAELTGLEAVFFCNSGTEATEAALKIARKHQRRSGHPQRTGFLALEHGFHGRTLGALSVTWHGAYREPFAPLVPGVRFVPAGDGAALEAALRADVPAALILEPIQGEGGVRELPHSYLRLARRLCSDSGAVLIHDEVQCGAGRTGTFLAGDHAGVKPDIATLAKPLAAGLPFGAAVVSAELAGALGPGDHGSTFGGGPLACRAADVFLHELREGLQDHVAARGAQLGEGLAALAADFDAIAEVRGRGLLRGLRMRWGAPELQRALLEGGLIANCTALDVVRFLPPYVVSAEQIDQALDLLRECLAALPAPAPGHKPKEER
jgi:acetylornithine aminotransferase/acetylornithine/N-succinyldiaminopimelate aminotransferase